MHRRIRTFVTLMALNTESKLPSPSAQKHAPTTYHKVLLMIPTLNEEDAIGGLLSEAHASGFANILVVDGFSSDRTREIAEQYGAAVVLQDFGRGKGCGVRTGMREFLRGSAEFFCIIDGDGTNIPSHLLRMLPLAKSGIADVILGSRTRGPRQKNAMDMLSLASNLTVSFLLGAKFRRRFTDVQTGYWLLKRRAVNRIYPTIRSTGFEVELEIFVKAFKAGLIVRETHVGFRKRKGSTKFNFLLRMRNLYYAFRFLAS
jgi:glycosyltransferase involved in cell wall biosynthesis